MSTPSSEPPKDSALDILGIKPVGRALEKTVDGCLAGASAFLSRVCLPAATELGYLVQDEVRHWRAMNAARIAQRASELVKPDSRGQVHPRLAWEIIEKGSWTDDGTVQKMWAGILAASVGENPQDDGNIQFVMLLSAMTRFQVVLLEHACERSDKCVTPSGLPWSNMFTMTTKEISELTGISDIQRIDRELDHLRHLSLFDEQLSGFRPEDSSTAYIRVTPLGLHLYVKSRGFGGSPIEYWNLKAGDPDINAVMDVQAGPSGP